MTTSTRNYVGGTNQITRNDRTYTVQYTDNLGTNWISLPSAPGLGLEQAITQPVQPRRFFRVREQ